MNPEPLAIILLDNARKNQAADLLTRAFQDDPAYSHIFPDPAERARSLRSLWGGLLTVTLRYGQVYTTPGLHGVACWMPPGDGSNFLWQSLRTGFALQRPVFGFSGAARKRFLDVIGHLERVRKQMMARSSPTSRACWPRCSKPNKGLTMSCRCPTSPRAWPAG
jgi:hypothetical protein